MPIANPAYGEVTWDLQFPSSRFPLTMGCKGVELLDELLVTSDAADELACCCLCPAFSMKPNSFSNAFRNQLFGWA